MKAGKTRAGAWNSIQRSYMHTRPSRERLWPALTTILVCVMLVTPPRPLHAQRLEDFTTPRPLPDGAYLVVGVLGGVERWNSEARPVNRLAADLRAKALPNVFVETIEHRHQDVALRLVLAGLDRNGDGKVDAAERARARIILYGHSMGGAAVVKLARQLGKRGIPVLLTVQVDSIGRGDRNIPSNVARAANFYQREDILLHGESDIRAEDPETTTIVGNFKYSYRHKHVDLSDVSPVERAVGGTHTKMEFDPEVWAAVEALIMKEFE